MTLVGLAAVDAAMSYAYSKVANNTPYGWDGKNCAGGPLDCSGLTTCAWEAAGYEIGAGTSGQLATGTFIVKPGANQPWASTVWEYRRGDLLFPGPEHVQLYDGEGWIVEAPHTGAKVQRVQQWATSMYAVRRVAPLPTAPLGWPGTVLTLGVHYFGTGKWQEKLNLVTNARITETSVFDASTATATKTFQQTRGLPVTGQVDRATWIAAFS